MYKKLIDLCVGSGKYGIPASAIDYDENKYRYLRISDISDDGVLLNNDKKSIDDNDSINYLLSRNDIVFARTGNSTGRTLFYEEKYGNLVYAGFLIKFKIDENKINPKYIKYYTISKQYKKWIINYQDGSTRGNMSAQNFASLPIPIIDRIKQDKLVNLLDDVTNKIELNNKIIFELEKISKTLYDYWFVQFDFPDEKERPYKSSGGKMVYSQELKREIPYDWEVIVLGEHITSLRGVSYSSPDLIGDGVPMINLACFTPECTYKVSGIKSYSGKYTKDKVLKPYDLVMCNTQQTDLDPTKDIIGNCLLVPNIFDKEIVSSHHVNHIIFDNDDLKYILFGESKTTWFHKFVSGLCSGTNILGLDFNGICKYKMVKPPKQILSKYAKLILNIESQKSVIIKENQQLTALRDFLLPLLMNSQVSFKK